MPDSPSTARELLDSALEFTKGWVGVQPGPLNLLADLQGWHSGRKERLRANPQTMDRDPDRRCYSNRHKRRRKPSTANHPYRLGLVGSAPQAPRDLALSCQSRSKTTGAKKQKRDAATLHAVAPSPVLAPGAALGSRLRVALSSGQVTDHSICDPSAEPLPVRAFIEPDASILQVDGAALWLENRTCPESDHLLRTRHTRSWAVFFFQRHPFIRIRASGSLPDRFPANVFSKNKNLLQCRLTQRTLSGRATQDLH